MDKTETEKAGPGLDGDGAAPQTTGKRKKKEKAEFPLPVKGETEEPTSEDYAFIRSHFAYSQTSDEFFFYHQGEDGEDGVWGPLTEERVNLILTEDLKIEGEFEVINPIKRFIMKKCPIRAAVMVAGYSAGIHRNTAGKPFLILETTKMIPPVKRDWSFLNDILQGLLGLPEKDLERLGLKALGIDQVGLFHCWMKWGMEALRDRSRAPGHFLIVMGPPTCGKTLLQEKIISPLLGCGPTDATSYLTGLTEFNSDLLGSFHLMISDGLALKNVAERKIYTERSKRLMGNSEQRLHAKYKNAGMVPFCCRLSNTLNPAAYASLPLFEGGMTDKLLILTGKVHSCLPNAALPRIPFEAKIAEVLPGYAYFLLNEWEIPANILETSGERFGFRGWINPDVTTRATAMAREVILAELIRSVYLIDRTYSRTNGGHWAALASAPDGGIQRRFTNLAQNEQSLSYLLTDLVDATLAGTPILNVEARRRKSHGDRLVDITVRRDPDLVNLEAGDLDLKSPSALAKIKKQIASAKKTRIGGR